MEWAASNADGSLLCPTIDCGSILYLLYVLNRSVRVAFPTYFPVSLSRILVEMKELRLAITCYIGRTAGPSTMPDRFKQAATSAEQLTSVYEVLVVDDSAVYRRIVEEALSSEPYSLLFAQNAEEALKAFQEHEPSMVISDWVMPDFTGVELCQRIRGITAKPYTYIILMTSKSEQTDIVKGLEAGADDYLTKPFDAGELRARVGVGRRIVELNRELVAQSKKLEEAAHTDSLTGLPNRRAIEDWASKQLRGAARHQFPFWVIVADLDSFKTINDTFGHEAGDDVLRQFAEILRKNTRASDICGRLGGDEFLLVLTHVNPEHIKLTVGKFREQFTGLSFPFRGKSVSVTASFGVAGFHGRELAEFSTLVQKADLMLYEAKNAGRNKIKVSFP